MAKAPKRTKLKMHEMELLQARLERTFYAEYITSGTKGQGLPSVNELAALCGVSPAVTRKFYSRLNDEGVIRTERRKGCFLQAPSLFRFQFQATERLIGVVGYIDENHPDTPTAPNATILQAMERAAAEHGWQIRFYNMYPERHFSDEALLKMAQDRIDAVFLLHSQDHPGDIKRLSTLDIPILIREKEMPGATCVAFDNHQIGVLATTYLLDQGHRKIGYVEPPQTKWTHWSQARKESCVETIRRRNPNFPAPQIIEADIEDPASVPKAVQELNTADLTAIFCGNDHIAAALIRAGLDRTNLTIVGVDNDFKYLSLRFSSVQVSPSILGESALKALIDHFDSGKALPSLVLHNGILIRRESGSVTRHDFPVQAAGF